MTYALSAAQGAKLKEFLTAAATDAAAGQVGAYATLYQFLFTLISKDSNGDPIYTDADMSSIDPLTWSSPSQSGWEKIDAGVDSAAWVFLNGVDKVNANDTSSGFNIFIREYSKAQYELRYGETSETTLNQYVQNASNAIARSIVLDVLGIENDNETPVPPFIIPSASDIAQQDAQGAAATMFAIGGNNAEQISGWAGNPLFLLLGVDEPYKFNILHETGGTPSGETYDILAMLVAMRAAAIEVGFFDSGIIFSEQTVFDLLEDVATNIFPSAVENTALGLLNIASIASATVDVLENAYGVDWWDTLTELALGDFYVGTFGDDSAIGGSSDAGLFADDELIHAGAGDDTLIGGTGRDIIDGGSGVDAIDYSASDNALVIDLQEQYSIVDSALKDKIFNIENVIGSGYADLIYGNAGNNVLNGGGGDDIIEGGGGQDTIIGGAGNDTYRFSGAFGQDVIVDSDGLGSIAMDGITLSGEASYDAQNHWTLTAGGQSFDLYHLGDEEGLLVRKEGDTQNAIRISDFTIGDSKLGLALQTSGGTVSNQTLLGDRTTADILIGGDGNDFINASAQGTPDVRYGANDTVYGGAGNDTIQGSYNEVGFSHYYGGSGNDEIWGRGNADGGSGNDTITMGGTIVYSQDFRVADYRTTSPILHGGSSNDTLYGAGQAQVYGDEGDDFIQTFISWEPIRDSEIVTEDEWSYSSYYLREMAAPQWTIDGGEGEDTLFLQLDRNVIDLGYGQYASQSTTGIYANLSQGYFELTLNKPDDITQGDRQWIFYNPTATASIANVENLYGTSRDDTLIGDDGDNYINGGTYYGESNNDLIVGGGGFDTFSFGADINFYGDYIGYNYAFGHDTVSGGEQIKVDDQAILGTISFNGITEQYELNDLIFEVLSQGMLISRPSYDSSILITDWSESNDYGFALGVGNQSITGTSGNDSLIGDSGNDTLDGGAGNDSLVGGDGFDQILFSGNYGNDTVSGAERIIVNGETLDGSQSQYTYSYGSLLIEDGNGNSIYLADWEEDGDYGITLGQTLSGTLTGNIVTERMTYSNVGTYKLIDWNGDGQIDILSQSGGFGPGLAIIDGASGQATTLTSFAVGDSRIVDFNGDGQMDIVTDANGGLGWYNGSNLSQFNRITYLDVGNYQVGDFNGDGAQDVVSSKPLYTNGSPVGGAVWFNASGVMTRISYNDLGSFKLADLDQDGALDIVAANSFYQSGSSIGGIVTYEYNAAGLSTAVRYAYIGDPDFQIAQMDTDAQLEVITNEGTYTSGNPVDGVVILEGNTVVTRFNYYDVGDYVVANVDGDSAMEIIGTQGAYQNGSPLNGVVAYEAGGATWRFGNNAYINVDDLSPGDWDGDGAVNVIAKGGSYGNGLVYFVAEGANDTLVGTIGNDTIAGGRGNDQLTGNAGSDIFAFARGMGSDFISDFELGVDTLQFSNVFGITSAQDVLNATSYSNGNAVITTLEGTITLTGVGSGLALTDFEVV